MKIKYSFLSTAVLATAILCFLGTLTIGVQIMHAANITTIVNPYVQNVQKIENPADILNPPDISFLTSAQIANLAQLNAKKIKGLKQGIAAGVSVQDSTNLSNALKKYNVPDSVQAELDAINAKSITWEANYNKIFVKSEQDKKKLASLKPDDRILNLLKISAQQPKTISENQGKTDVKKQSLAVKILAPIKEIFTFFTELVFNYKINRIFFSAVD